MHNRVACSKCGLVELTWNILSFCWVLNPRCGADCSLGRCCLSFPGEKGSPTDIGYSRRGAGGNAYEIQPDLHYSQSPRWTLWPHHTQQVWKGEVKPLRVFQALIILLLLTCISAKPVARKLLTNCAASAAQRDFPFLPAPNWNDREMISFLCSLGSSWEN